MPGPSSSVLDGAFALLEAASALEDSGGQRRPMEAATKYFEACYLMKRYVNRMPLDTRSGSESSKTRRLLLRKISHYEKHASDLIRTAGNDGAEQDGRGGLGLSDHGAGDGGASVFSADATELTDNRGGGGGRIPPPSDWRGSQRRQSSVRNFREERISGGGDGLGRPRRPQREPSGRREALVTERAGAANARLASALDLDERGRGDQALKEYMAAAEEFLEGIRIAEELKEERGGGGSAVVDVGAALKRRLEGAMGENRLVSPCDYDRRGLELTALLGVEIVRLLVWSALLGWLLQKRMLDTSWCGDRSNGLALISLPGFLSCADRIEQLKGMVDGKGPPNKKGVPSQRRRKSTADESALLLTDSEISVLMQSSTIASGLFMPWSDQEVRKIDYKTSDGRPWRDPDGLLKLSPKQKERLHKWARPVDINGMRGISATPVMIKTITPYSIRQRCVTDCSFIASLCICAAFERRFKKRLVTSIIYPQDRNGLPVYNPCGKYAVKLWLNGVARQVVVDDLLPVDRRGNLLCSHTNNPFGLELWVSIIEKAYMKLCGGYDFPGSNSGVDLFSLTGWIPERLFFPEKSESIRDFETPPERAWERLYSANAYGDCLITVSTSSDITEKKAEEVGLVTGHAYAVLSVIQTSNGTRLLQLKNPWAHQGWKGRYSPHDRLGWRDPSFCAEVGYDPKIAMGIDDGVFWIGWEDVLVFFRNLQLSWNPALFLARVTTHSFWPMNQGPADDSFNIGDNPQYILTLSDKALESRASVWILLSRHVTKHEQEGVEVNDYLTLHIHRNSANKERMWYPGGKTCVMTGAYTNNCHVLVRYDVTGPEDKFLSLVLSQYQKSNDLSYTLSCFCTSAFKLCRPVKDQPFKSDISSEWTEATSGGPPGQVGFQKNPMWSIAIPESGVYMQVRCSSVKTFAINVMMVKVDRAGKRLSSIYEKPVIDTGDYRHGFVATNAHWIPGGHYTLIVSTFHPGQVGRFRLMLKSSIQLKPTPIA